MTAHATWNDVRRIVDELEVKIHLAGMDARDRWHALQPRLAKLEQSLESKGERAGKAVVDELTSVRESLRKLRDTIADEIASSG